MPTSISTYGRDNRSLRILITDDHALVRRGIIAIIRQQKKWSVVGEAENGHEAINLVRTLQPDVVLMDVSMPKLNGIDASRRILEEQSPTRVILFTLLVTEFVLTQALAAGVAGIVDKLEGSEFIVPAVIAVAAQQSYFSPKVSRLLARISRDRRRTSPSSGGGVAAEDENSPCTAAETRLRKPRSITSSSREFDSR